MEIVVNEWLLDYLRPDAEKSHNKLAVRFIENWVRGCYRVVIRKQSPFSKKLFDYMKQSEPSPSMHRPFSKLHKLLFRDSDKTLIVDEPDIKGLPEYLKVKTPGDDKYLVELSYSGTARVIVTTDTRLKDALQDEPHIKIYLLEEFLRENLPNS